MTGVQLNLNLSISSSIIRPTLNSVNVLIFRRKFQSEAGDGLQDREDGQCRRSIRHRTDRLVDPMHVFREYYTLFLFLFLCFFFLNVVRAIHDACTLTTLFSQYLFFFTMALDRRHTIATNER